jgi:hypothetical protein
MAAFPKASNAELAAAIHAAQSHKPAPADRTFILRHSSSASTFLFDATQGQTFSNLSRDGIIYLENARKSLFVTPRGRFTWTSE